MISYISVSHDSSFISTVACGVRGQGNCRSKNIFSTSYQIRVMTFQLIEPSLINHTDQRHAFSEWIKLSGSIFAGVGRVVKRSITFKLSHKMRNVRMDIGNLIFFYIEHVENELIVYNFHTKTRELEGWNYHII